LTVEIRLYALVAEKAGTRSVEVVFDDGSRVGDAIYWLVEHYPVVADYLPHCRLALDMDYVGEEAVLHDGATLAVIPPVSGGLCAEQRADKGPFRPFRVTTEALDARLLERYVRDNHCGAVVTFTGVVREFTGDRQTRYLEYEAHAELAEAVFGRIADAARKKWPGVRMAIWHRVGRQAVGETSIVIAVAAPHRAEAFEACRFGIDKVKEDAPVWKKEVYEGGSHWVGAGEEEGTA